MKNTSPQKTGCTCHGKCECGCKEPRECSCELCEVCREYCRKNQPYCCGDDIPLNRPESPQPPGWTPGDKPKQSPFTPGMSGDDKFKAFDAAVFGTIRASGSTKGPRLGPRKKEWLPLLVIRANQGDHGARPFNGVFWESPDIFVAPDMAADTAPDVPPTLGGFAKAGAPNTLWAHVWNLGRAPAYNVRVEFYWCNPSLGINSASAHLIGVAHTDLGDRYSGKAHKIVKCPETWIPSFVNNGHECLVVRVFEPLLDSLPANQWDVTRDRHIGQRNIAVVNAASPAHLELMLKTGCSAPQGEATIRVEVAQPSEVGWLSLLTGKKEHGYKSPPAVVAQTGLMQVSSVDKAGHVPSFKAVPPATMSPLLRSEVKYERTCDEKEVFLYMNVDNLTSHQCVVYRIRHVMNGKTVGGYTVIARKS